MCLRAFWCLLVRSVQKPYIIISELMSCSLADAFNKSIVRPSPRRKVIPGKQAVYRCSGGSSMHLIVGNA
eukprot:261188-Chlamydomonas_euryale.AAC.2